MLGTPASGWSFPSGHTLLTSAPVGALVLLGWRRTGGLLARVVGGAAAVSAALLMGMSRLYLGGHWPTDVRASYAPAVSTLVATAVGTGVRRRPGVPAPDRRPASALAGPL
jgi:undecaprenyl-diphosphatase